MAKAAGQAKYRFALVSMPGAYGPSAITERYGIRKSTIFPPLLGAP
jgi:hypothetical protein